MEKLLLEAITHIKSIIKKKPKMERLLTYINKYSATNCHEATIQDTLFILHTKNLIDENLKLLCENNKLVDGEISSTPVPGPPNTSAKDTNKISDIVLNDIRKDLMQHVNRKVENLKVLIDNEFTTIRRSIEDLKRTNFITENMSLIDSLKEEVTYLRKENIIKTEIMKSLTEKNQLVAPVFLQNEYPNSESNTSLANNEKISHTKNSTENEHHRDNSSLLAKENNKGIERRNDEKEKPKLKNKSVKKTLIMRDSTNKNVDGWRLNQRMKSIVSVRSISGARTKAMKDHVMGYLEDGSPDTILLHHGTNDLRSEESAEKIASNVKNVALSAKNKKRPCLCFRINSKK